VIQVARIAGLEYHSSFQAPASPIEIRFHIEDQARLWWSGAESGLILMASEKFLSRSVVISPRKGLIPCSLKERERPAERREIGSRGKRNCLGSLYILFQ